MNSLSWLLYAADLVDGVWLLSMFGGAGVLATAVISLIAAGDYEDATYGDTARKKASAVAIRKRFPLLLTLAVVLLVISAVTPKRGTVLTIAASEVGEELLATDAAKTLGGEAGELATDSLKLLRKYVTEQLGDTEAKP